MKKPTNADLTIRLNAATKENEDLRQKLQEALNSETQLRNLRREDNERHEKIYNEKKQQCIDLEMQMDSMHRTMLIKNLQIKTLSEVSPLITTLEALNDQVKLAKIKYREAIEMDMEMYNGTTKK